VLVPAVPGDTERRDATSKDRTTLLIFFSFLFSAFWMGIVLFSSLKCPTTIVPFFERPVLLGYLFIFLSFPRCCVCVFSSLQCPTTIVPFFGDQFFWGSRVCAAGWAPSPSPSRISPSIA